MHEDGERGSRSDPQGAKHKETPFFAPNPKSEPTPGFRARG